MAFARASMRLASSFDPPECFSASAYSYSTGAIAGLFHPTLFR